MDGGASPAVTLCGITYTPDIRTAHGCFPAALTELHSDRDNSVAAFIKEQLNDAATLMSKSGKHQKANFSAIKRIISDVEDEVEMQGGVKGLGQRSLTVLLIFYCVCKKLPEASRVEEVVLAKGYEDERLLEVRLRLRSQEGDLMGILRLLLDAKRVGLPLRNTEFLLQAISATTALYSPFDSIISLLSSLKSVNARISFRGIRYALSTASTFDEAKEILLYVPIKDTRVWPDKIWASWIRSCLHDAKGALKVLSIVESQNIELSARMIGAAMGVCNEARDLQAVTELFRRAIASGVQADVVMMTELIRSCYYQAELRGDEYVLAAEDAWATAVALGMEDDVFLWQSLLLVYVKVKDPAGAHELHSKFLHYHPKGDKTMSHFVTLCEPGASPHKHKSASEKKAYIKHKHRLAPEVGCQLVETAQKMLLQMYKPPGHGKPWRKEEVKIKEEEEGENHK